MKRTALVLFVAACLLAGITSNSFAAATACMPTNAKNVGLTAITTGTIQAALFVAASSTLGPTSTTYSTTGELATAHGYTQGGNTLTGCSVANRTGATPPAVDWTCTGGWQWTATDSTGITADTLVIYRTSDNYILGIYTFTSASATGNGATFTITPPTIADGTRGALYLQ